MTLQSLLSPLHAVVREAGARIMEVYAEGADASFKSDGSPVTVADQAAEAVILKALSEIAPDIPVVSEENADSHALAAVDEFFLVDPLDGTKEFLRRDGQGSFTVNIALVRGGTPVLGVVYAPALDRLFSGSEETGAEETSGGVTRALALRAVPETGAVAVASKSHRDEATNQWLEDHGISETISIGSSLKFCLVASGEADVYPRFGPTMEWDTAAGDAVLRAAGGRVTNPDKSPFLYGKPEYRNGAFIAWGSVQSES
ncbi:3'(2'),5'-bisphosphate nucleotidase CysQ [Coralliovum pocilloporae]|uniref:3'(2'),5'-bisphosphate nucleotidase CysQ n=1 Tax=Coralliovum pocilloporae TaxID=3066369 RepID=UPI003307C0D5